MFLGDDIEVGTDPFFLAVNAYVDSPGRFLIGNTCELILPIVFFKDVGIAEGISGSGSNT